MKSNLWFIHSFNREIFQYQNLDFSELWHYNDVVIRFALRISEKLYAALKEIAEKEQRSINGEILYIIEQYIKNFVKSRVS